MKGVILAGGTGTRLLPYTKATNKHLLPLGGDIMVMHSIGALIKMKVTKVMLITSYAHSGKFVEVLGNGTDVGLESLLYAYQEKPAGIADALGKARDFVHNETIVVMLADNAFEFSLAPIAESFRRQDDGARIVLASVDNPEAYGVATLDEKGNLIEIVEKPSRPKSKLVVTGAYFYPPDVFSVVSHLKPSGRDELEITDVNNHYLNKGMLKYSTAEGGWWDAGESIREYGVSDEVLRKGTNK